MIGLYFHVESPSEEAPHDPNDFRRLALASLRRPKKLIWTIRISRRRKDLRTLATLRWLGHGQTTPIEQEMFVKSPARRLQTPARCLGPRGATNVRLKAARKPTFAPCSRAAWRLTAPKQLVSILTKTASSPWRP